MTEPLKISADTGRRIAGHIARLGNADSQIAYSAERRLIRFGAKAVEALLAATTDPNPQVRYRAVWALGKSQSERVFEVICVLTEDADQAVRYDATRALGELGDPRAVPFLENLARQVTPKDNCWDAALSALKKLAESDTAWAAFIAREWQEELADPREDIYTLEDGEPIETVRPEAA